jgi:hypothetical protein
VLSFYRSRTPQQDVLGKYHKYGSGVLSLVSVQARGSLFPYGNGFFDVSSFFFSPTPFFLSVRSKSGKIKAPRKFIVTVTESRRKRAVLVRVDREMRFIVEKHPARPSDDTTQDDNDNLPHKAATCPLLMVPDDVQVLHVLYYC